MKKNVTEMVFILDKSGSMFGLEADTIGGFNSMIEKQKKLDGDALVTTIMFNQDIDTVQDRVSLKEINALTEKDYEVGGCTALLDAIGMAIEHIKQVHKYIREEDCPEKTMFVIMTDGLENASRKFNSDAVKKLIEQQKLKGWEFIFLGANIEAVETAKHYGITEDRAVDFLADSDGVGLNYAVLNDAMTSFRVEDFLDSSWKEAIEEDYKNRH